MRREQTELLDLGLQIGDRLFEIEIVRGHEASGAARAETALSRRRRNLVRSTPGQARGSVVLAPAGACSLHHLGQAVGGDVGVDLGGGDVGVAQQGLDHAQVGAAFQQVGGEGVAQDVGADPGGVDAGVDRGLVQQLGEAARGQVALAPRWTGTARGCPGAFSGRAASRATSQAFTASRAEAFSGASRSLPPLPRTIR